ncbi:MAG: CooT family nickel-binding protein [Oscillospiraceae bacterium]|nr:CooT family nickel-binding protein [Oscillospiraceae bacterium]
MCLSTAMLRKRNGELEEIMRNVSKVRAEREIVVLVDILGEEFPVPGTIAYCDLVNGKLEIDEIGA